jgi:putative ABC transport system substrate-binding protein
MLDIRRRQFITLLGGAVAAWPLAARAQQAAMPVIGFLDPRSPEALADRLRGFRQGVKEIGYVEGENVAIVYRFAENQDDRLPELAADLVRRQVAVIAAGGPSATFAAKAATTTIPTVFLVGDDPVRLGLVTSLSRPGGNMTGFNLFNSELAAKRLELLRELVPRAARVAMLSNPADANTETQLMEVGAAARAMGLKIQVFNANSSTEIDAAFETMGRERYDAVFVGTTPFLNGRRIQLVQLAAFHRLPATYALRDCAEAGGLMSYGSNIVDAFRQVGIYAGRILKGAKPADLPVVRRRSSSSSSTRRPPACWRRPLASRRLPTVAAVPCADVGSACANGQSAAPVKPARAHYLLSSLASVRRALWPRHGHLGLLRWRAATLHPHAESHG